MREASIGTPDIYFGGKAKKVELSRQGRYAGRLFLNRIFKKPVVMWGNTKRPILKYDTAQDRQYFMQEEGGAALSNHYHAEIDATPKLELADSPINHQ